jgi:hypothetical protein
MGAQNSDAVALLAVFVITGVAVALALLIVAGSVAAVLALAQGRTHLSYTKQWADSLPKAILIVSGLSAALVVSYAVAFGR